MRRHSTRHAGIIETRSLPLQTARCLPAIFHLQADQRLTGGSAGLELDPRKAKGTDTWILSTVLQRLKAT